MAKRAVDPESLIGALLLRRKQLQTELARIDQYIALHEDLSKKYRPVSDSQLDAMVTEAVHLESDQSLRDFVLAALVDGPMTVERLCELARQSGLESVTPKGYNRFSPVLSKLKSLHKVQRDGNLWSLPNGHPPAPSPAKPSAPKVEFKATVPPAMTRDMVYERLKQIGHPISCKELTDLLIKDHPVLGERSNPMDNVRKFMTRDERVKAIKKDDGVLYVAK